MLVGDSPLIPKRTGRVSRPARDDATYPMLVDAEGIPPLQYPDLEDEQ